MEYAKVENGSVTFIGECPLSTDRVSNFYLLSDEEKISWGYYPVIKEEVILQEGQEIPSDIKVIRDNKCYYKHIVIIPETVINKELSIEELRFNKIIDVKTIASMYIISKYPVYKQINASLNIYGEEFKQDMISYIQGIRDKVSSYTTQINNSTKEELVFTPVFE
jgi:hypothetical protein